MKNYLHWKISLKQTSGYSLEILPREFTLLIHFLVKIALPSENFCGTNPLSKDFFLEIPQRIHLWTFFHTFPLEKLHPSVIIFSLS